MLSEDQVIEVQAISKRFEIYDRPQDRLKQMLFAGAARLGAPPRALFKEFWALRDVSFSVQRGETLAIIGANGSGKSTLLQILCGTRTPTTGQAMVRRKVAALLELGAGFNPEFTGRENIRLSALLYGITEQRLHEQLDSIIAFADIGAFIDQPVKSYSSGMYVRVAFAIAAHVDAEILVIDEALSVGDIRFSQRCMRFLRDFQSRGTLLFVSHDLAAVVNLCSRAIWLNQGRLVLDAATKEVVEAYLAAQHALDRAELGHQVNVRAPVSAKPPAKGMRDTRHDELAASSRATTIELFEFDPNDPKRSHGTGGASIVAVTLVSAERGTGTPAAGELARLDITAQATSDVQGLIFGFYLKDRLGQQLFGDNTYLTYLNRPVNARSGDRLVASFTFSMPTFRSGSYSIDAAIAAGSQASHTQLHWLSDALVFEVAARGGGIRGLIGWPMTSIAIQAAESHAL